VSIRRASFAAAFCLCAAARPASAREDASPLTVLSTGETHAMLTPCDCPFRPEGGLARRAAAVAKERAERPTVLVDAGGWAAGGMYDEYTEGAEVDSVRTEATARAMAAMGYDAVALSDEELALGSGAIRRWLKDPGLPLVSANLFDAESGERFAPSFVILAPHRRVAVIGLSPAGLETLTPDVAGQYRITPPVESAREAVREAREAGADAVVVLSPLGEEMSERLAREVDGIDLIVNAGRRTSSARHFRARDSLVTQFDFQGRALVRTHVDIRSGSAQVRPGDPVVLGPGVPDDPKVAVIVKGALAEIEAGGRRRVLSVELFKMSLCPFCPKVEGTLSEVARAIPERVSLRVTHIVRVDAKGGFDSLHGEAELDEARRQVAVFRFYPAKYWDYAAWRAKNPGEADWESACRRLGISVARVKGSVASGESDEILRRQAHRAGRLRVSGSPTLYLGGRRYEGGTGRLEILRAVCSVLPGGSEGVHVCKGLPACFSDVDCRKPGFVGECRKPGTKRAECVHYLAVKVEAVVVEDARAVHSPVERILDSLRVFFPGLEERRVDSSSPEGRELVERYGIDRLPAYLLDKAALKERKIDAIREVLTPAGDRLLVAPRLAGSHQDITRRRIPGRVDLFLAPHSTAAAEALEETLSHMAALAARGEAAQVIFRSAVRRDAEGRLAAPGGLAEIEAMLREIAVARQHPDRLSRYLRARLESTGSSYWRDPLLKVGLDPAEIRRIAESDRTRAALDVDAQELAELGAAGPVVLLVANQEVVPVGSRAELRHALEAAGAGRKLVPLSTVYDRVPPALPLLVRALEAVPEAARGRVARGLAALTGEDFGQDVERWKAYMRSGRGPIK
jgi:predicted DsbA family dithiol-disulfide isomerase